MIPLNCLLVTKFPPLPYEEKYLSNIFLQLGGFAQVNSFDSQNQVVGWLSFS